MPRRRSPAHAAEAGYLRAIDGRYGRIEFFANDTSAVSQSLATYGEWAENELGFLRCFLRPGMTVLDVGAFVGTHAMAFAKAVGPKGAVWAFEAQPATFAVLKSNLATHDPASVHLVSAAVSDRQGDLAIAAIDPSTNGGFGSASLDAELRRAGDGDGEAAPGARTTRVRAVTIDSLDLSACDLIKIDVEGAEDVVLRGASATIKRCKPIVYAECNSVANGLLTWNTLRDLEYEVRLHLVDAFASDNFFQAQQNIFGPAREAALIGVPLGAAKVLDQYRPRPCELLVRLQTADDLVLGLLNKPQFPEEALRRGVAAADGADAWFKEMASLRSARVDLGDARRRLSEHEVVESQLRLVQSQLEVVQGQLSESLAEARQQLANSRQLASGFERDFHRLSLENEGLRGELSKYDALNARYDALNAQYETLKGQQAALEDRASGFEDELRQANQRLRRPVRNFGSWLLRKATSPYREGRRVVRRIRRLTKAPSASEAAAPVPVLATDTPTRQEDDRSEYAYMAETISRLRQEKIEAFVARRPAGLIECPKGSMRSFASCLAIPPPPSNPEVSIVIPVYNGAKYILECLAAIARHTIDQPFEIIIVDDCSEADTAEILACVPNVRLLRNESNLGFLLTCNRALEIAAGRFTLFLNSDTQVQAGWLEALLSAFAEEERVGAVGPKLIYPDGRLQEAGALINRNATSTLIGLSDDPNLARYNFRREIEYCSGACLLVETSVLKELGGFDPLFAPAYCEDVDLCFRLRARGLRVVYEPRAVVVHHLSATTPPHSKRDLITRNQQKLAERWQPEIDALSKVRLIAFYLPQFHPIPENDRWWGKGFTEWSSVTKAVPNFSGHDQPNLPADLGYYDLRLASVSEAQAALAKRYGVHGFCYYYYWFGGRRLLEHPLERLLSDQGPDLPFCIAWANENWTRHWDGQEREVLVAQSHPPGDDIAVIRDMIRYLRRPNYIRINGRPLLVIYRPSLIPNISETTATWRAECRRQGIGEIYLAMVDSFGQLSSVRMPAEIGFDAAIEFPPHHASAEIDLPGVVLNPNFSGRIHDYRKVVASYVDRDLPDYVFFRGVIPRWDNTPRQQDQPQIFYHASPGAYQAWLETAIQQSRETAFGEERLVFINAWNEWAEGAYLEPDRRFGHEFLEATRNSLETCLLVRNS